MPQQVQELINKIRQEGVDQATQQANEIKKNAETEAKQIIADATHQAKDIVIKAEADAKKLRESGELALQQSARNMLISLRKDIEHLLGNIVKKDIAATLSPEQLGSIIQETINAHVTQQGDADIKVLVSPDGLKALEQGFITKLKDACQQPLTFRATNDIGAGFIISFDGGKSQFEFTDQGLADFISAYLNDELALILKNAVA